MHGLVRDGSLVVFGVFAFGLQVIHFVETQHYVMVDVSDFEHRQQLQIIGVGVYLQ